MKAQSKVEDCCIECKFTDKKGFKVTLEMLEKLWNQSLVAKKKPLLVVGVRRNDNEVFVLTGELRSEQQRRK
jgi:Holliday junction resolvase